MIQVYAISILFTLFAFLALIWIWLWLYEDFRVDFFRQRMFALRDELFDEGCRGAISFDHPAYKMLRSTMNGFIRFGHKVRLTSFLGYVFFLNSADNEALRDISFDARWKEAIKDLPTDVNTKMWDYKIRMNMLVMEHLLLVSPLVLLALVMPVSVVVFMREIIKGILGKLSAQIECIDSAALTIGSKA